jgi:hypothetical protein
MSVWRNGRLASVFGLPRNPSWNVRRKEASLLFLSKSVATEIGIRTLPQTTATTVEISCLTISSNALDVYSTTVSGALTTEDSHLLN